MKIVLVHGFNVKDGGAGTVDTLIPFMNEYEVDKDEGDYGYFNLFMIRIVRRRQRARVLFRLAKAFQTADVIITHSNGAHFTTEALDLLPAAFNNTKKVIHISPALNSSTPPPNAVKAQLVLYTPHDGWVKLASFLPLHPWGRMGARGYTGDDNRVTSIENPVIKKHSDWFKPGSVEETWKLCHAFIK